MGGDNQTWARRVGANVRRLRRAKALTQEDLAGEAGIGMRHLGRIERGEISPTVDILAKVAEALGVHPAVLLGGSAD
jgi:transcriptional regulator with XRE-family HTH domain